MINRTPFFEKHVALGGKIVDFHGWELPVQYSTITLEHNAVRNQAGLFDISHMGQVFVTGPDAEAYLQNLITNDMKKAVPGKGIYAHLLNEKGGVIDDIFVFHMDEDRYLVIINASRREPDVAWMEKNRKNFNVDIIEPPFAAGLALQGPVAQAILNKLSPDAAKLGRHQIGDFQFGDVSAIVTRTGYTGEDGYEFFGPAGHLMILWDQLFLAGKPFGLLPCGLGARDTLRTEVAYPLYGHELDETHTPFEAGLDWVVKLEKGDFIGRDALVKQKSAGLKTKLAGFKVLQGGVARPEAKVFINGIEKGVVTSGTFSPTLGMAIGMAWAPADLPKEGVEIKIMQGTRELSAITARLPFYAKPVAVK